VHHAHGGSGVTLTFPDTYIRTWQGWLYLAVVMDLFSRKIVGWSASATINRDLVLDAVMIAVRQR
jgi:putative transposase